MGNGSRRGRCFLLARLTAAWSLLMRHSPACQIFYLEIGWKCCLERPEILAFGRQPSQAVPAREVIIGRYVSTMKLKPVESEMLRLVGYDAKRRVLEVIFNSGDRYRYFGVSPAKYEALLNAESIGQYMHKNIIGHYDYQRVP